MKSSSAKAQPITQKRKLQILQDHDPLRHWVSLDDKRVCMLCEKEITGRQIRVEHGAGDAVALHCPTPGCKSNPAHWVYPGNPLLSENSWNDWMRGIDENDSIEETSDLNAPHR